jgi:hypothetical protein
LQVSEDGVSNYSGLGFAIDSADGGNGNGGGMGSGEVSASIWLIQYYDCDVAETARARYEEDCH